MKRPCTSGAKRKVEAGLQEETENPDLVVQFVVEEINTWDGLCFQVPINKCILSPRVVITHRSSVFMFSSKYWFSNAILHGTLIVKELRARRGGGEDGLSPCPVPSAFSPGAPEMVLKSETNLKMSLSGEDFRQTGKTH